MCYTIDKKLGGTCMISAIIDLGSNTVRLSIYEWKGKEFSLLMSKKATTGLASYIYKKSMSQRGINTACDVVKQFKKIVDGFNINDIHLFATAPLRNITNAKDVIAQIRIQTGLQVHAISGEEEANLAFIGAKGVCDIKDGLVIDIGGGSSEIVYFKEGRILQSVSLSEGSLSLYHKYCTSLSPNKEERKTMRERIQTLFDESGFIKNIKIEGIVGVGGTIRASHRFFATHIATQCNANYYYTGDLDAIIKVIKKSYKEDLGKILKVAPERIHTLLPGLIILDTIVSNYEVDIVYISKSGVREGYLIQNIMGIM